MTDPRPAAPDPTNASQRVRDQQRAGWLLTCASCGMKSHIAAERIAAAYDVHGVGVGFLCPTTFGGCGARLEPPETIVVGHAQDSVSIRQAIAAAPDPAPTSVDAKRCPFCGELPAVAYESISAWSVDCKNPRCMITPGLCGYLNQSDAVTIWNERVTQRETERAYVTGFMDSEQYGRSIAGEQVSHGRLREIAGIYAAEYIKNDGWKTERDPQGTTEEVFGAAPDVPAAEPSFDAAPDFGLCPACGEKQFGSSCGDEFHEPKFANRLHWVIGSRLEWELETKDKQREAFYRQQYRERRDALIGDHAALIQRAHDAEARATEAEQQCDLNAEEMATHRHEREVNAKELYREMQEHAVTQKQLRDAEQRIAASERSALRGKIEAMPTWRVVESVPCDRDVDEYRSAVLALLAQLPAEGPSTPTATTDEEGWLIHPESSDDLWEKP